MSLVSVIARVPCRPGLRDEVVAALGGLLSGAPDLHLCRPVRAEGHVVEG